jgi:hypothetical protein
MYVLKFTYPDKTFEYTLLQNFEYSELKRLQKIHNNKIKIKLFFKKFY